MLIFRSGDLEAIPSKLFDKIASFEVCYEAFHLNFSEGAAFCLFVYRTKLDGQFVSKLSEDTALAELQGNGNRFASNV